jgi:hypothetical protein
MLDAYIIEQIRQREEERRRVFERPSLKIPLERDHREIDEEYEEEPEPEPSRVIIIDL